MRRKWMTTNPKRIVANKKTKKCGVCRTRIKGPARKIGGKYRCYWCNKRICGH